MKIQLYFSSLLFSAALALESSEGPYSLKFDALEQCVDAGTDEFHLNVTYDEEKGTYSGIFSKNKALDDDTEIAIHIERLVDNEWKEDISGNVGGACSLIRIFPSSVQSMLDAINFSECPIPEGTSVVKNMKNDFQFPFMTTAKYGKRRGEMTFLDKKGKRLGCVYMKANVVPA
ncbi:hypothetical protein GE061_007515 [Apolygus lucorum]|uniref:MD-2-related lipid-recognition domain-containing protein n=1 Tax=Apolygus lucorum TaxID=248454 RepID=A0A6A4IX22_APOLU|nr:hypothetical protein GE061_007515 [Apolygus lucorum]